MKQGAKPVLAVDVDEVLFPLAQNFADYHNEHHGTSVKLSDFTQYSFENDIGIDVDDFVKRIKAFSDEGFFRSHQPAESIKSALKKLTYTYDLIVITSRWQEWEHDTQLWLDKHFPGLFTEVHFANSLTWHRGDKRDKASICQQLDVDVLIDDSLHNAEQVSGVGLQVLLFGDYPWNQADELPENVRRVKDWSEVVEVLQ